MEEKKAKLSVIIPVYNAEKYLHRCVDSVLAQTFSDIEIILVDDGSIDKSPAICDEYVSKFSKRISVIHQKNGGASEARNTGLKIAKGEYVSFVDADDYIAPDMYDMMWNVAIQKGIDIVFGNYATVNIDGAQKNTEPYLPEDVVIINRRMRELVCNERSSRILWFGWKSIFRRKLLEDNGINWQNGNYCEDTLFNLKAILCANKCYFINRVFYYYVQTPGSLVRKNYKVGLSNALDSAYRSERKYQQNRI